MDFYLYLITKPVIVFLVFVIVIAAAALFVNWRSKLDRKNPGVVTHFCSKCGGDGRENHRSYSETRKIDGVLESISYDVSDKCSSCGGSGGYRYYDHNPYTISMLYLRVFVITFVLWGIARWLPRDWFDNEIVNHYAITSLITYLGLFGLYTVFYSFDNKHLGFCLFSITAISLSVLAFRHVFTVVGSQSY